MTTTAAVWPANTTAFVECTLTDSGTGAAITTAAVVATVYDAAGVAVTGATGVALPHAGSGVYRWHAPDTLAGVGKVLDVGRGYYAIARATVGADVLELRLDVVVREIVGATS